MSRSKEEKQYERKQCKKLKKEQEKQKSERVESFLERKKDPNYKKSHFYLHNFNPAEAKGCLKIMLLLLVPIATIGWAYVDINPEMKEFRESILWIIGSRIIISFFLIYCGFFSKEKHGFIGKFSFSLAAALPWFNFLISNKRIEFIALVFISLFFAAAEVFNIFFKDRKCLTLSIVSSILFLLMGSIFSFVDMIYFPPKYYIIPLIFGVICWFLASFMYDKGYIHITSKKPTEILLSVLFISSAALFFIMPATNYMFDTSEGVSQQRKTKKTLYFCKLRR